MEVDKMRAFIVHGYKVPSVAENHPDDFTSFDTKEEAITYARSIAPKWNCVVVSSGSSEIVRFQNGTEVVDKKKSKIQNSQ
jgi:hypothetical protein